MQMRCKAITENKRMCLNTATKGEFCLIHYNKIKKDSLKQQFLKEDLNNIQRIIYMWRRYCGRRCWERTARGGKLYTFADIDQLEHRIKLYFEHKDKFDYDKGEVILPIGEEDEVY